MRRKKNALSGPRTYEIKSSFSSPIGPGAQISLHGWLESGELNEARPRAGGYSGETLGIKTERAESSALEREAHSHSSNSVIYGPRASRLLTPNKQHKEEEIRWRVRGGGEGMGEQAGGGGGGGPVDGPFLWVET